MTVGAAEDAAAGVLGSRRGRDSGSGSVIAIGLVSAVALAATLVAFLGAAATARAHAQSAADLAALAAAAVQRVERAVGSQGSVTVCEAADRVAERNASALVMCELHGDGSVTVGVAARSGPWIAHGTARAGPAW